MAIDPAERPPSAAVLLERLDALSPDGPAPVPPRPVRPLAEAVRLPPALAGGRQAAFVGRTSALGELRDTWRRALAGEPGVVLVRGNAGIGKTRLCTQFAREVHAEGGTVLYGRCEEEALAPYGPFVEALRQFAVHQPDLPQQLDLPAGFALARLGWPVPGAAPQAPPEPGSDRAAGRYQLFETAVMLVGAMAAHAPLLVIFDDVHWADVPTLRLLRHLVRFVGTGPVMLVCTLRDDEPEHDERRSRALEEIRREPIARTLDLAGLSETETAELVVACGQAPAAGDVVSRLRERTAGNPFYIEETLHGVRDLAELRDEDPASGPRAPGRAERHRGADPAAARPAGPADPRRARRRRGRRPRVRRRAAGRARGLGRAGGQRRAPGGDPRRHRRRGPGPHGPLRVPPRARAHDALRRPAPEPADGAARPLRRGAGGGRRARRRARAPLLRGAPRRVRRTRAAPLARRRAVGVRRARLRGGGGPSRPRARAARLRRAGARRRALRRAALPRPGAVAVRRGGGGAAHVPGRRRAGPRARRPGPLRERRAGLRAPPLRPGRDAAAARGAARGGARAARPGRQRRARPRARRARRRAALPRAARARAGLQPRGRRDGAAAGRRRRARRRARRPARRAAPHRLPGGAAADRPRAARARRPGRGRASTGPPRCTGACTTCSRRATSARRAASTRAWSSSPSGSASRSTATSPRPGRRSGSQTAGRFAEAEEQARRSLDFARRAHMPYAESNHAGQLFGLRREQGTLDDAARRGARRDRRPPAAAGVARRHGARAPRRGRRTRGPAPTTRRSRRAASRRSPPTSSGSARCAC